LNSLAVVVPVKSSGQKSRLSGVLPADDRRRFSELLLAEVLDALGKARLLGVSHVVSSDTRALQFAKQRGAGAIAEPRDAGVDSAVMRGVREAGSPESVLVLPSDLPFIKASEIRHILDLGAVGLGVVLVPSATYDGTNALLFRPGSGYRLSYDNDSFWNHLKRGAEKGLSIGVSSEPGLMFDVDSPADFGLLAGSSSGGAPAVFARKARR